MVTNKISKNLKKELRHLFYEFPPDKMRTFLRKMCLESLNSKEQSSGPTSLLKDQLHQMHALLDFLDTAADETLGWERTVAN